MSQRLLAKPWLRRQSHRQNGLTVIESLIALAILSFGLLGVAALIAQVTKYNSESGTRTLITEAANMMIDRMRANPTGVQGGFYDNKTAANNGCTSSCTPQQLAQDDLFRWNTYLAKILPGGAGVVCTDNTADGTTIVSPGNWSCDGGGGGTYYVKISWLETATSKTSKSVGVSESRARQSTSIAVRLF
jgi:type IV pilus assembly protein PilV